MATPRVRWTPTTTSASIQVKPQNRIGGWFTGFRTEYSRHKSCGLICNPSLTKILPDTVWSFPLPLGEISALIQLSPRGRLASPPYPEFQLGANHLQHLRCWIFAPQSTAQHQTTSCDFHLNINQIQPSTLCTVYREALLRNTNAQIFLYRKANNQTLKNPRNPPAGGRLKVFTLHLEMFFHPVRGFSLLNYL